MDLTLPFRRLLTTRIFQAALLALPTASLALAGCSSVDITGTGGGTQNTSAGTGHFEPGSMPCFPWPEAGATGAGGATGTGTTGTTGATGAGGSAVGGAGGMGGGTTSSGGDMASPCPTSDQAPLSWGFAALPNGEFADGPIMPATAGMCCYSIVQLLGTGRPFMVEESARTAPVLRASGEAWREASAATPQTQDLTSEERALLAAAWTRDGLFEHASVASFGRFALELLAVGAPSELIEQAHQAAIDEVRHARLCLGLASAYAGATVAPARFPFDGRVEVDANLATVAARAAREGCIGETLAAIQAAEQLAHAEDPAVRAALAVIAEDEARHAELAWRTVAWALRTGGDEVRLAITAVFAEITEPPISSDTAAASPALLAHGRLSGADLQATLARGLVEVVMPSARALLATSEAAARPS
jgi:hypothetical protein